MQRKRLIMKKSTIRIAGFTLAEVLIAVTLTLILLGLMIRVFAISGGEIAKGRALLEMAGQLRATSELLRRDLKGATTTQLPRNQAGSASGYFEYIEGAFNDRFVHTLRNGNPDTSAIYGDVDDILMFTARSMGQPFRGRFGGQVIESNHAEIAWWTVFEDQNGNGQFNSGEPLKLYRRVLLIRPDLVTAATDLGEFLQFNDLSVRVDPNGNIIANTLSDLSDRANRFARAGTPFPHEPNYAALQGTNAFVLTNPTGLGTANLSAGEDVALAGITAFDVRIFDPTVQIRQPELVNLPPNVRPVGLSPGDFGYAFGTDPSIQFGGYVDLNIDALTGINSGGLFTRPPGFPAPSNMAITWNNATYCTWSNVYEFDGIDQDGDGLIDEGTNELDDDLANGADDVGEYETRPPYPLPVRGIEVTIRMLEETTQVVRQTSVIANFVPE